MKKITLVLTIFLAILSSGCVNSGKQKTSKQAVATVQKKTFSFHTKLKHATGFSIQTTDKYKLIDVYDPWNKNKILASYLLTLDGKVPENLDKKYDFHIQVPVKDVAILSSTHIGPLVALGVENKVKGASDPNKIYNKELYEAYKAGELTHLGSAMNVDFEKILELSTEVVFKSGFNNVTKEMEPLVKAGVNVAYNVEWMESNLLARAEWVKFMAAFFLKDKEADSIFNHIEKEYFAYRNMALASKDRPEVLSGMMFKGTWYMPGGQSYAGLLFKDAGASYYYASDSSKGSLPLSFEVVLDKQLNSTYWVGLRIESRKKLLEMDTRYKLFKAFEKGNIYCLNKRMNENGGNDYWESGVMKPHRILGDYVKILYPDLLPDYELFYHKPLTE